MPPSVIDVRSANDVRDVVHRAVQALAEGKLVAIPTETVYGVAASALSETAVRRLCELKGRGPESPFALAIKGAEDAVDYVPDISPVAARLTRRCWPGPLTLVVDDVHPDGLLRRLPAEVQKVVVPNSTVGLRVPAHSIVLDILRMVAGPLVLTSANRSGQPESITGAQVAEVLAADVDLILDDGRSKFGQSSSVVRVRDNRISVLREGVFSSSALSSLASFMALFVCTGNTCRSPMAEALFRQLIAKKIGCNESELDDNGVAVASAGIAAMPGGLPSAEAVEVMSSQNLDITRHESQPLTERLIRDADIVLTMTRSHRQAIVAQWPTAAERVEVLGGDGTDVSDPIGGPVELYSNCANQIKQLLAARIEKLDLARLLVRIA